MSFELAEALRSIGLCAPKDTLEALFSHATKSRLAPVQVAEQLVAVEKREREARNLASRTTRATLGTMTSLDRFDWSFPRTIDRGQYEKLLTLEFSKQYQNVLFRGSSGVGKTTLAQNIGLRALENGKSVCFSTVNGALADLLKQESLPAIERRIKRYTTPNILILDELGYLPCDARSGDLLYTIISRRHERASTILTTNLAFKDWGGVFPGAACVVAMVDRFTQHCHTVDIEGDSWRQRQERPKAAPLPRLAKKK